MVRLDDFVLDRALGFAFDNPEFKMGYTLRKEMMTPDQFERVHVENQMPQTVHMLNDFLVLAGDPGGEAAMQRIDSTLRTQKLLDQVWRTFA